MSWPERAHPLVTLVALGAVLRAVAVFSGHGWFAVDDYAVVVEQGWRWSLDPQAPFIWDIRSPLVSRAAAVVFAHARGLGLSDPVAQVRLLYSVFALWSLCALPPIFLLARSLGGSRAAFWAGFLWAAGGAMPRLSSRALVEVACAVPLCWGVWCIVWAARRPGARPFLASVTGGVAVGAAALLRFHVGLVAVGLVLTLGVAALRRQARPANAFGLLLGLTLAACLQLALDLALGRGPFGTVLAYLTYNAENANRYGTSPWHTYLWQLLAWSAPPATLWLAAPFVRASRRAALVFWPAALFFVAHSAVAHKEERFLFPILPLLFVLLGVAFATFSAEGRLARLARRWFVGLHLAAALASAFADSGRAMTTPLLAVGRRVDAPPLVAVGFSVFPWFYLGRLDGAALLPDRQALLAHLAAGRPVGPLLLRHRRDDDGELRAALSTAGLRCDAGTEYAGDVFDRAALALNPEHNKRRRPTFLIDCVAAP